MCPKESKGIDIASIRRQLAGSKGTQYWRSLEEVAQTDEFQRFLKSEFPSEASRSSDPVSRRRFLEIMGASLALAGLSGCTRQPPEKIVPYVRAPEEIVPGKPLFFATTVPLGGGIGMGVLVESHMGRPTKIEGNPQHPASLGAVDPMTQASILGLYDPDRSQVVTFRGGIRSWDSLVATLRTALSGGESSPARGLRILTETVTSPTAAGQLASILAKYPEAKWHQYEPIHRDTLRAGAILAYGEDVDTQYRFERADVLVSFDADFLGALPGHVRYARDYAARRRVGRRPLDPLYAAESPPNAADPPGMNRLYAIESSPSSTGAMADVRAAARPAEISAVAWAVAAGLGVANVKNPPALPEPLLRWTRAVVEELKRHRGSSVVVAGVSQPSPVHALMHAINQALGNTGQTVIHTAPVPAHSVDQTQSLTELVADIDQGKVTMLVVAGGNPVYNAPPDLGFAEKLLKVPLTLHLSPYLDETSQHCQWHIPAAHPLESWGDSLTYDGTASLSQPLIAPLYNGKTVHELFGALLGEPRPSAYDIVRQYWKNRHGEGGFESFWRRALHDGVIPESAYPPKAMALRPQLDLSAYAAELSGVGASGLDVLFRSDAALWDGRFANNGWLQELPRPLTKLTWDNAALLSPATAERLGLQSEDVVELELAGRRVKAPVWIQPAHADHAVTLTLGYGRRAGGKVAEGAGFDAFRLRTAGSPWTAPDLTLRKVGERYKLATTQHHHSMEGRALVREATLEEYLRQPDFAHHLGHDPQKEMMMFPARQYEGHAWGMTIDLNICTGCNACMVACQAENNVPVVGKSQVAMGRAMHWIRVDRYYKGDIDNPETVHQPVPCMQCENAPCEIVCPVGATSHSSEGLNDMVYNRCVGTRYCSNNCPYKVRRFNFLLYADYETPSLKLQRNPDVTVRSRGVMEKCTYCVQRINDARIQAKREGREIRDGDIVTACQGACPTQAIVFGDINDPASRVSKMKADPRNYGLLTELNTRPRTTYLARLRNPGSQSEGG